MNKQQKQVIQSQLNNEKIVLHNLQVKYKSALDDINKEIAALKSRADAGEQYVIYQVQYQEAMKTQISGILDTLKGQQFNTISDYLQASYEDGFVGTMYDLHGQGIPLVFPIDQKQVVKAIQHDSPLVKPFYEALGENITNLKFRVTDSITRGIASNASYSDVAKQITRYMVGDYSSLKGGALYDAMRIARTEAHRIGQSASYDAQIKAKEAGADIVKQWDAALDKRTRPHHARLDGQIRELDKPFEVAGRTALYPGAFGVAAEDINCRCAVLQRAKWALDDDELETLKERAKYFGLDKNDSFEEFKNKYLKASQNVASQVTQNGSSSGNIGITNDNLLTTPVKSTDANYNQLLDDLEMLDKNVGCDYIPVTNHTEVLSEDEIIQLLCGGDQTKGSCASVGLAYVGQKQGWNVLDFRDGESRSFFSSSGNLMRLSNANGIKTLKASGASSLTVGNRLLKQVENGKEYYLCVGRHAAIVRRTDQGILQYLELQSASRSGWTNFNGNPRYTLNTRFGCSSASSGSAYWDFMIDIEESDFSTDEFKSILGYLNTDVTKQRKGLSGTIK